MAGVSRQVVSHTIGLTFFHVIIITSSGCLSFVQSRPNYSSLEGNNALVRARYYVTDGTMVIITPFALLTIEPMGRHVIHQYWHVCRGHKAVLN